MKLQKLLLITFSLVINYAIAQNHQLIKKWETDSLLKVPESVLYDAAGKILYVSNIDGQSDGKDGKGSIAKVGLDGKIINAEWVTGLDAPKGIGIYKNMLWVADLTVVAGINISTGKIEKRIAVPGAVFLNDVTIDSSGVIYVSDTRAKKVYRVENDVAFVLLENLQRPNGLLVHNNTLYVLDNGGLFKMENNSLTKLSDGMEAGTDGVEHVKGNEFIVSCWDGTVYYINEDGSKQKLLDTREQKINSADIGYDAKSRTVYVPTFFKNTVAAYELK